MSIRKKLLLIYTILIAVLVFFSSFLMIYVSTASQRDALKTSLLQRVIEVSNSLVDSNGVIDISANVNYYSDGVYIGIFKEDGTFIAGKLPEGYVSSSFSNGQITEINHNKFIYYDYYLDLNARDNIYVRGITSNSITVSSVLLITSAIVIPVLLIIAVIASFFIFKKTLDPITQLTKSVDLITSTDDFSNKIEITSKDPDIKLLEKSFNKMLGRLKDLFQAEEELTSDVSHELRTPLSVMLGECEYALECNDENERVESLNVILKETNKMIHITKELLEFQRMKNHDNIELVDMNASAILEDMTIVSDKNIKLVKNIKPNVHLKINETLFIEMVQNLLDNACKYGVPNGITTLTLTDNQIIISDNGIGISSEDKDKIFMRFYQVDKSRSNKNSLGLGLSFVAEIARLHNASINVESELGKGSSFIITFNN